MSHLLCQARDKAVKLNSCQSGLPLQDENKQKFISDSSHLTQISQIHGCEYQQILIF